ncbi:membrane lipoprotein [Cellulomonas sp. HD19AZ1]|uniref:membrane lipoprotein n=1 Tax=Cellulomonas sp. HD19AZ1 TaxID=2559593 RepID=UPI001070A340|nr:membrane lipoprotein [Cellulomonas sp. HD19AZ1]TFH69838.1 membrane lipoprotein [Cellulomonas sp. HD19AZ1]
MPRRARATLPSVVLLTALLAAPVLTSCAGLRAADPSGADDARADGGSAADVDARLAGAGVARDLVRVTHVDGLAVATQSVGVSGDEGFGAAYVGPDGAQVLLRTSRTADPSAVACADLTDDDVDPPLCGVEHEGVHVTFEGDGVDAATLRAAGEAVRVPSGDELAALVADLPEVGDQPVERGDLPPGDGAPRDDVGEGG